MVSELDAVRNLMTCLARPAGMMPGLAESAQRLGVPWLHRQGLAALTWYTARDELARRKSEAWVANLRHVYLLAAANAELRSQELEQALRALSAQAVVPTLLKGAVLAYTVYPDPACRPMGDLDFWVTDDEMPRAQAALERLGYAASANAERPVTMQRRNRGEIQLRGTRPGQGLIELHWGAFPGEWLRQVGCVDEEAVRGRVLSLDVINQPAWMLTPEDGVIHLAIHLAVNHQMAAPWLRGILDLALLARAQPVDWETVARRADEWRVKTAVWLVLQLALDLAGLNEAATCVGRLAPRRFHRWMLGQFANPMSLIRMRDVSTGPARFVYLLLLADRLPLAVGLAVRTLWPERAWLQARYGRADASTQWLHLASAVRGRI